MDLKMQLQIDSRSSTWGCIKFYLYSQWGLRLRPRHFAAAASSAATCSGASSSSWCHGSRHSVYTLDVAMKNFKELDNNSYVTITKTWGECITMYWEFRLPLPCMTLIYVHDTVLTLANPVPEAKNLGMEYTPIQGANITSPSSTTTLFRKHCGHTAWSIRQLQMKSWRWNLRVETWHLRFYKTLH